MASAVTRKRTYAVSPVMLLGSCQAALARIHGTIERQEIEQGRITATVGGSELKIKIDPLEDGRAHLTVTWHPRRLGGDRTMLQSFLTAVDSLARSS